MNIIKMLCIAAVLCPGNAVFAQTKFDFARPVRRLPPVLNTYASERVPEATLANTPRIETLLQNGTLKLSLNDAITLALENNLDVAIARYNLAIADTDIMRTKAGQSVRGVATGLVQGTPGGGVGGFGTGASGAGGTSGGAGGAGTGTSGLVQSTFGGGASVRSFDPTISGTLQVRHETSPLANTVLTGVPSYQQNTGGGTFSYSQAFPTGTSLTVGFDNSRSADNSVNSTLLPQITSEFRLNLRQPLLAGFGVGPNRRFILIARNSREISDISFRNQVIATVSQIQNIYWDLVSAYENLRVKERSFALAEKTLADNREQVRIGSLAPIEVIRAENEVSSRQEELLVAQTQLQLQELLMKNAVTRSLDDPLLAEAKVLPTDTMVLPENEPVQLVSELIADAHAHRPDLATLRIDLANRRISNKAIRNNLLPSLDLFAWYGASGLAGEQNPYNKRLAVNAISRSGFPNAFASLFRNDFPDYAVGLSFNIPIRNRAGRADQIRSELEYRQAQLLLQQRQNEVGIQVRNAHYALQQNRARVDTARKARDLARRTFDIEQKKRTLGASTSVDVLQAQRDLAQAESALVTAMSAYEKSRVELDRVTGLTLAHNGIDLEDAERGSVEHMPNVPGAVPRQENK